MYLKEAFRYQKYLDQQMREAFKYLSDATYVTKTTQEHQRKKANPDAENETVDLSLERRLPYTANQMIDYAAFLMTEIEKLTAAIRDAKRAATLDIDGEVYNNKERRFAADFLLTLAQVKSKEKIVRGMGYKFNAEGNQVSYTYDIKEVSTIDFDRNKVKAIGKAMKQKSDEMSMQIDKAMVELEVAYVPVFDVNDSFEDAMEKFLQM